MILTALSVLILPIGGHFDGLDVPILTEAHHVNAHKARVAVRVLGTVTVIYAEVKILLGDVEIAVVSGTVCNFAVSRAEHVDVVLEGAEGRIRKCGVDTVGALRPGA